MGGFPNPHSVTNHYCVFLCVENYDSVKADKCAAWQCESLAALFPGWEAEEKEVEWTSSARAASRRVQKLHHRMSFSLMSIYIALNIAGIQTETHTTRANEVGFNQSVTRIGFFLSEIRINKAIWACLKDGKTLKKTPDVLSIQDINAELWIRGHVALAT